MSIQNHRNFDHKIYLGDSICFLLAFSWARYCASLIKFTCTLWTLRKMTNTKFAGLWDLKVWEFTLSLTNQSLGVRMPTGDQCRMGKVTTRALLKAQSQHSPGGTGKPQSKMVGRRVRTRILTHCRFKVRDVTAKSPTSSCMKNDINK